MQCGLTRNGGYQPGQCTDDDRCSGDDDDDDEVSVDNVAKVANVRSHEWKW